jgi:ABC-type Zn uptake system ZnuABC Zn-binding protein ZnuA
VLRTLTPAVVLSVALVLAGCGADPGSSTGQGGAQADRLDVVATTTVLQEFVQVVGGDLVELTGLMQRGVDAHDYAPTPADLVALGEADVLVENGLGLESWLQDTVSNAGFDGVRVDASEGVAVRELTGGEEAHAEEGEETHAADGADPHIWQDPRNAVTMVENVAEGLATADPDNASTYEANAAAYVEELRALDQEVAAQTAALQDRRFVSQHDAFGYYLDRYDFEFVGAVIPSSDTNAELSGAEVAALVEQIRQTGARAVFSEVSLPPATAETVAREAGVEVVAGEDSLYADGLGPEGSDAATYPGMIRHNTRVIVGALGG